MTQPEFTPSTFPWSLSETEKLNISREYNLIKAFYDAKRATRSGVPLINHIDEGLAVLKFIGSSYSAMSAFCIHPIVQADADLKANYDSIRKVISSDVMALAMEYRSVANEYLSHRNIKHFSEIRLSPLPEVNEMLIADKVQNYKDFLIYHHGTHPRSFELNRYFCNWMYRLDVWDVMDAFSQ